MHTDFCRLHLSNTLSGWQLQLSAGRRFKSRRQNCGRRQANKETTDFDICATRSPYCWMRSLLKSTVYTSYPLLCPRNIFGSKGIFIIQKEPAFFALKKLSSDTDSLRRALHMFQRCLGQGSLSLAWAPQTHLSSSRPPPPPPMTGWIQLVLGQTRVMKYDTNPNNALLKSGNPAKIPYILAASLTPDKSISNPGFFVMEESCDTLEAYAQAKCGGLNPTI